MKEFDTTKEFDATKFSWDLGVGVADCSEIGLPPGHHPYVQVYNDAADVGMTLVNPKRGTRKNFVLTETITVEGDTVGWKFESTEPSIMGLRKLGGKCAVTIYND
jgi:hypothetical protein